MDREKLKEDIHKKLSELRNARYAAEAAAEAAAKTAKEKRERSRALPRVLASNGGNREAEEAAARSARSAAAEEARNAEAAAIKAEDAAYAAIEAAEEYSRKTGFILKELAAAPPRVAKRTFGHSENIGLHSTLSSDGKAAVQAAFNTNRGKIHERAYKTYKTGPVATLVPIPTDEPSTDNLWYGFFKGGRSGGSTRRGRRSKSRRSKSKRSKKSKRNMGKTRRGKTRGRNTSRRATI